MQDKKYMTPLQALLTGIGTVIGSGIFFKADNILESTQGNAWVAILGWLFIGTTLIFAGLTIAILAARTKKHGGFVAYVEDTYGETAGYLLGWFQTVIYIPAIIGILGIVATTYILQLFSLELTLNQEYLLTIIVLAIIFLWNILSTKFSVMFSSISTIIKLLPLIFLAIMGLLFGEPGGGSTNMVDSMGGAATAMLFFAPLLSMAFAFDGWINVGSYSADMKNPEKDLPRVFIWMMVIITLVYTLYFTAITFSMPADQIIAAGDAHVGLIVQQYFGNGAMSLVLVAIIISVLGAANGNIIAGTRYAQRLGEQGKAPFSKALAKISSKTKTAVNATITIIITSAIFMLLYFLQALEIQTFGERVLLGGIELDTLPIALNSILYVALFVAVIRIGIREKLGIFKTWLFPVIAIIGQAFILGSLFATNPQAPLYLLLSGLVILLGWAVMKKEPKA